METITKKDSDIVRRKLKLTPQSKILNVSHFGCMDGSGSSIPIYNSFKNVSYVRAKYEKINEIVTSIDYDKYDAVFFTDIAPTDPSLIKTPKNIVIIDHHETATVNHDPDNMRFVYIGESASLLTKKFVGHYFNKDLSYLDEMSNIINDYDMWLNPHGISWEFSVLHYYYLKKDNYSHTKFIRRFCNGDIRFNAEEIEHINRQKHELEKAWNRVNREAYELPYEVDGVLFFEGAFVNELSHRFLDSGEAKITFNKNPNTYQCSVRCPVKGVSIGNILNELGVGGGHDDAGGFHDETQLEFQNNLNKICKHLYENYEVMRVNS